MPDPSYMAIKYETLQQAQDDLAMAYAAVQSTVDDLETKLQASLSEWTGSAQSAYLPVKQQWDAAIAHMASVLNRAHVHLANANDMYQTVEQQNTSIWH